MNNDYREIELKPTLGQNFPKFIEYCSSINESLIKIKDNNLYEFITKSRDELKVKNRKIYSTDDIKLRLAKSIVLDLIGLGLSLKISDNKVLAIDPSTNNLSSSEIKDSIRKGHLIERDTQLNQSSVREFVNKMECRRLTSKGWHSIFSLIRDGKELAEKLDKTSQLETTDLKISELANTIQPYLHFVDEEPICEYTGLDLREVWRYFRHTWINAYKTLPGRSMMILIRDAAAKNHPVIGIAALGSPVVKQKLRDKWIGWDDDSIIDEIRKKPNKSNANWLANCLDTQINSLYLEDLFSERICSPIDIDYPTEIVIKKLNEESLKSIELHRKFPNAAGVKADQKTFSDEIWEQQARTKLFRSKRCSTLATLLSIKREFQNTKLINGTKKEIEAALSCGSVLNATRLLIKRVKAEHVGINMMDIVVCGALAPYNVLLGGKLVCMLLCSPEVVQMYAKKYNESISIIASSMKGKPIIRKPSLVLLTTTSLYGNSSSQYNRIKMPSKELYNSDHDDYIEYKKLGKSEGYGTYQFSDATTNLMEICLSRNKNGRKVNSIFGEGINPRMRKIRDGLEMLNMSPDKLLIHGNPRIVYGIILASNCKNILLGKDKKPKYILPPSKAVNISEKIVTYWYKRWLIGRISNKEILDNVKEHQLSFPIIHGAKVNLPNDISDGQLQLWEI